MLSRLFQKNKDMALVIGMIMILVILFSPIPPAMLDLAIIANLGLGLTGPDLIDTLTEQGRATIPLFNCPTRRPAQLYHSVELTTWNFRPLDFAAKADYAANAGGVANAARNSLGPRPKFPFVVSDCDNGYPDCAWLNDQPWIDQYWTGIAGDHSGATVAQVTDGTSATLLACEKWLYELYYDVGTVDADLDNQTNRMAKDNPGDNGVMYAGYDYDTVRECGSVKGTTKSPPMRDSEYDRSNPQSDKKGAHYQQRFGGPHAAGLNAARCDGSVGTESFEVDPIVWAELGSRNDGGL